MFHASMQKVMAITGDYLLIGQIRRQTKALEVVVFSQLAFL